MPRKSRKSVEAINDQNESPSVSPPASTPPQTIDEAARSADDQSVTTLPRGRSFKSILSVRTKGVTLGERNGHDWVISFPEDPGKEIKDNLRDAGFAYRDGKWKVFTHAANRAQVERLAKDLNRQAGDTVAINDYPVQQVVLAFDAPPGEEVTARLREGGFHYRPDRTWNADYTPENRQFASDFIQSLPDVSRSAAAGR